MKKSEPLKACLEITIKNFFLIKWSTDITMGAEYYRVTKR